MAIRLSRKVAAEIDAMFEQTRREHGFAYNERLLPADSRGATVQETIPLRSPPPSKATVDHSAPIPTVEIKPLITLGSVYQRFMEDPTKRRSARTLLAHQTTCRVAKEVLGTDTPVEEISRENCREFLEVLRWLPVNHSKKYPKLTVREAAERAKVDKSIVTINATNLNAYMARFATMLNWAVAEG